MRDASLIAALMVTLSATSGCSRSIVGEWQMVRAAPSREVFAIDDARFDRSGRFEATVTIDGKTNRETGTYRFTGFTLTMRPDGGGARAYPATVKPSSLEIGEGGKYVILRKDRRTRESAE